MARTKPPGHLQSIPAPEGIFDLIGMDFWGPTQEKSTNGNRYVLVLTDYLSKFVMARATPKNDAQTVAEFVVDVASTFGVPKQLLTDQGTHFRNELVDQVAQMLGCQHTLSTAYHPQTNGQVERWNATLRPQLNKLAERQPNEWDKFLSAVVSAYNSGEHASTGISPFELMFGREPSLAFDPPKPIIKTSKPSDYLIHLQRYRDVLIRTARDNIAHKQHSAKLRYNENRSDPQYAVGDLVFVRTPPHRQHKFGEQFEGPYCVTEMLGRHTLVVEHEHYAEQRRVHTNMIKPVFVRTSRI